MIIESISIKNFRQFFHEIELQFSTDKDKNVTVIHGANGSGKTSLLNAFKWCFYGQTDFDTLNEKILNESAIQEKCGDGVLEIRIEVKFRHENRIYCAIRHQRYRCIDNLRAEAIEESKFALDVMTSDGQTFRSKTPYLELQSILPADLQPYFFFNGERIEHIAGVSQSGQVRDAIRKLMGLELVDRAIVHLSRAKSQYRKLVKEGVSDEQKELHDLIEELEESILRYKENVESSKRSEDLAKTELKRIERELKKYEKSRELQEKRDALDDLLSEVEIEIRRIRNNQKGLLDENGFLAMSKNMFSSCTDLVEENRKKGVLPYGIKEQFIDDRIDMGVCICGNVIEKGGEMHRCLLNARKTAGTDDIESAYTSVSALLKNHGQTVEKFESSYKDEASLLSSRFSKSESLRIEIDEVSSQLIKVDDKRIAELENAHREQETARDQAIAAKGTASHNLSEATSDLEEKAQLLQRLEEHKSEQNIAKLRMVKCEKMIGAIQELRDALTDQVRIDLSNRVDKTFQSIIRKPIRAVIDDDYCLQVLKTSATGTEFSASEQSTGERQVTSLSFISSIIALAKEKHMQKTLFFNGGLYPLVMDSPFGALDDDYREKVAKNVSELAEQVIMFVSNSQWQGRVRQACEGKVGMSYQLVYHIPHLAKEKQSEYEVSSDNEYEYSTVREVS